ncbi:MAG TPA: hypothetical protein VK028_00125 [Micromonosporaceae bacterium]|nr:hypothetical protein [Micromonosporaceae bacterium]
MPRRNRPRTGRSPYAHAELDEERARRGAERVQTSSDGAWLVRYITADGATKSYRCPGCEHEIPPGMAHVVSWPADERGDVGDRRHWHRGCWNARTRRAPVRRLR